MARSRKDKKSKIDTVLLGTALLCGVGMFSVAVSFGYPPAERPHHDPYYYLQIQAELLALGGAGLWALAMVWLRDRPST